MTAEKWHHSEICIAINDESEGSVAKHLRNDKLLTTHLSFNVLVKKIL